MPRAIATHAHLLNAGAPTDTSCQTAMLMGTFVTIHVVGHGHDHVDAHERATIIDRALDWFRQVEACCNRFDAASELRQLTAKVGSATPVSPMLFEAVRFALAVAEDTNGAFDPTVGHEMEKRGFNRDYQTGQTVRTELDTSDAAPVSYRDVQLDAERTSIILVRPLLLDLGAVAKGLAIDMAARELKTFRDYAIDAGGDLYVAGRSPAGEPWSVGIRHPRLDHELIDVVEVSDQAVCTSGDYERRDGADGGHHILDPRVGASAAAAISATVIAPTAMLADALATAAFVLGPAEGIQLLERHGVDGLIVSPTMERYVTRGYAV